MPRKGYDNTAYYEAKKKLPLPDGVHCIVCGGAIPRGSGRRKYCGEYCADWWKKIEQGGVKDWGRVKADILRRDGHRCCVCGTDDKLVQLEVHHVLPIYQGGEEFDFSNCITLCQRCHRRKHRYLGRRGKHKQHIAVASLSLDSWSGGLNCLECNKRKVRK